MNNERNKNGHQSFEDVLAVFAELSADEAVVLFSDTYSPEDAESRLTEIQSQNAHRQGGEVA